MAAKCGFINFICMYVLYISLDIINPLTCVYISVPYYAVDLKVDIFSDTVLNEVIIKLDETRHNEFNCKTICQKKNIQYIPLLKKTYLQFKNIRY